MINHRRERQSRTALGILNQGHHTGNVFGGESLQFSHLEFLSCALYICLSLLVSCNNTIILSLDAFHAPEILFSHLFVTAIKNMEQEGKVGGK